MRQNLPAPNGTTPPPLSQIWILPTTLQKVFRKKENFYVIFEITSKKILNQNFQIGGFYFLGTAFNDKLNGTYPPPVSFLYVEN